MPRPRRAIVAVLLAAGGGLLSPGVGCGTKAVGVDDCRTIEDARCQAAASCPEPIHVDDVEACQRFYRDHCLHGMDLEESPSSSQVDACVRAIEAAARCADADPETTIDDCGDVGLRPEADTDATPTVCGVIERPELLLACSFLSTSEASGGEGGEAGSIDAVETAGAGGAAGDGTSEGGASGAASAGD